MTKFTPSPWIIDGIGLYDSHGNELARMDRETVSHDELMGNIKLMAAAPDLYGGCKESLLAIFNEYGDCPLARKLKNAINKAEEK